MNLSNIAILILKYDYCCIISGISKNEPINLMQNIDLTKKSGICYHIKVKIYYHI